MPTLKRVCGEDICAEHSDSAPLTKEARRGHASGSRLRRLTRLTIALATLALVSCGGADDGDPTVGTGSAGGNPLRVAFDVEDSDEQSFVRWRTPILNAHTITRFKLDDSGGCTLADSPETLSDGALNFNGERTLEFEPPYPCALELQAKEDEALLTVNAKLNDVEVGFEFLPGAGVRINIERPELLEQAANDEDIQLDAVVVFDLDKLLDGVTLTDLLNLLALIKDPISASADDPLIARLLTNLSAAITIYLDPTPGDGVLLPEERDEIFATFELLP